MQNALSDTVGLLLFVFSLESLGLTMWWRFGVGILGVGVWGLEEKRLAMQLRALVYF
jgi:hypothetical protein